MNAERLHALVFRIKDELQRTNAVENVEIIAAALQRVTQQTTGPTQQQLADAITQFRTGMEKSEIASWSPAWIELLKEIGYHDILGPELRTRIEDIISRNEITPAIAKEEVDAINGRLQTLRQSVTQLDTALNNLQIGAEALEPGDCEVGFLIPRPAVDNELDELGEEFEELDMILRTISEVATGDGGLVKVRTISSTDFMLFVTQLPAAAALLAFLVDKLVVEYKNILEFRKLHSELSERMGKKSIKEVETFAETEMTKVINAAVEKAIKRYGSKDSGRRNELRTALDVALRKLADRIDRGFNIEVRIEALPAPSAEEESDAQAKAQRKEYETHRQVHPPEIQWYAARSYNGKKVTIIGPVIQGTLDSPDGLVTMTMGVPNCESPTNNWQSSLHITVPRNILSSKWTQKDLEKGTVMKWSGRVQTGVGNSVWLDVKP